ncbi:MAG: hypothetical protein ACLQUZ_06310 [Rhizomicrobium sp.]
MKFRGIAVALWVCVLAVSAANAQSGLGQVILQNETSQSYDLWIDGHYVCTALPHIECLSAATAGNHMLSVQQGPTIIYNLMFELGDGGIYTYTVTRPPP